MGAEADGGSPKVLCDDLAGPRLELKYLAFSWTAAYFMSSE